jgi:hypothetical protein
VRLCRILVQLKYILLGARKIRIGVDKGWGSPPPAGSKNDVFKLRSVNNIVIAPARTGRESRRSKAVIATAHTNRGIRSGFIFMGFMLIVEIKFTAPRIDETPARCREKIARSTDAPAWARPLARGGNTVHPVPAPLSTILLVNRSVNEGGNNQNLILFIHGAPSIKGTNQFPNPPIMIGITTKKIITKAWAVTITL